MSKPIGIAYVIESLGSGGAERQLVELVTRLDRAQFIPRVLTFTDDDFYADRLERSDILHHRIRRKGRWDLRPVVILADWLRRGAVRLIHGFLHTGNFYAVVAKLLAARGEVIATERNSVCDEMLSGVARYHVPWSFRRADLVIANSGAAREKLVRSLGLKSETTLYLPNAINTLDFYPAEHKQRADIRRRLGWPENEVAVLVVSSFKKQKNPLGLVHAISQIGITQRPIHVYWAGEPQPRSIFDETTALATRLGLTPEKLTFLGQRSDVADLYRACDVVLLYSFWEGTANVILEAQATGCPVVATDVADAANYVIPGETGWLVHPGNNDELATVLREIASIDRNALARRGADSRSRLLALDRSPDAMARRMEGIYAKVLRLSNTKQREEMTTCGC